jgi:hypothetical protein
VSALSGMRTPEQGLKLPMGNLRLPVEFTTYRCYLGEWHLQLDLSQASFLHLSQYIDPHLFSLYESSGSRLRGTGCS